MIRNTVSILALAAALTTVHAACGPGNFLDDGVCTECPAGTYQFATDATECLDCTPGTFSISPGAQGFDLCRRCPPGTFNPDAGATSCRPCRPGTDSNEASERCFRCGPGRRIDFFSERCEGCGFNTFSDQPNNRRCTGCPINNVSKRRSTQPSDCKPCPPGTRVGSRGQCEPCFFGQVNDGTMSFCRQCPRGFFTMNQGQGKCDPCPPNTFQETTLQFCRDCPEGTGTAGTGNMLCRRNGADCPPNTFTAKNGDCLFCNPGFRLNKREGRCDMCPTGSVGKGGLSTKCKRCKQAVSRDGTKCTCNPGSFMRPNGSCKLCPPGTSRAVFDFGPEECEKCSPGSFSSSPGSVQCETCPFDTVSLSEGATKCETCPPGLIPDRLNRNCISPKTGCPPGLRRPKGLPRFVRFVQCVEPECPAGTFRDSNDRCTSCSPGFQFVDDADSPRCARCALGGVSDGGLDTTCTACENGTIPSADFRTCVAACPAGTISRDGMCVDCAPGTFSASADSSRCRNCPANTVAEKAGSSSCEPCPEGTFSYGDGFAVKCLPLVSRRLPGACRGRCVPGVRLIRCEDRAGGRCRVREVRRTCTSTGGTVLCTAFTETRARPCSTLACP